MMELSFQYRLGSLPRPLSTAPHTMPHSSYILCTRGITMSRQRKHTKVVSSRPLHKSSTKDLNVTKECTLEITR